MAAPAWASKGGFVDYVSNGQKCRVRIVAVHKDDVTPYFTIAMPDGREKQTILDRLHAPEPMGPSRGPPGQRGDADGPRGSGENSTEREGAACQGEGAKERKRGASSRSPSCSSSGDSSSSSSSSDSEGSAKRKKKSKRKRKGKRKRTKGKKKVRRCCLAPMHALTHALTLAPTHGMSWPW